MTKAPSNGWPRDSRLRVVVLAGGNSAERAISLRSGAGVAAALATCGHQVELVDPAATPLAHYDWSAVDACFIALHGGAGEDGRVQQRLAQLGVPFTGSDASACRTAMSKLASKRRFVDCDVPTPPWVSIAHDDELAYVSGQLKPLGYPLVIKPDDQGSSVGVALAHESAELAQALAAARTYGGACLAEPLIVGREFTIALLDDRALPTIEIVSPEALFSYDAKYHSSLTQYEFDFELPASSRAAIEAAAVGAGRALEMRGLSRVDLMLAADGTPWLLEVNAVPGLTPRSLAPLAAARAGIDMPTLCDMLVRRCLTPVGVL